MTYQRIKILSCRIILYLCRKMFKQMPKVKVYILWVWLVGDDDDEWEYSQKQARDRQRTKVVHGMDMCNILMPCTTEEQAYLQIAFHYTFLFLSFLSRLFILPCSISKSPSAITSPSNMVITRECKMANMFVLFLSPMKIWRKKARRKKY